MGVRRPQISFSISGQRALVQPYGLELFLEQIRHALTFGQLSLFCLSSGMFFPQVVTWMVLEGRKAEGKKEGKGFSK